MAPPEGVLVLIVDDESPNRMVLRNMMAMLGHESIEATNGAGALELCRQRRPDLVLLDIMMPVMDGYQVLERLRADRDLDDVLVIVISGLEETENTIKCLKLGADDYLAKPFHTALLRARINACLRRKQILELEARHRRQLQEWNQSLEQKVAERSRELLEAQRRLAILDRTKGEFLQLISHHLRTPVTGLLGVSDILFEDEVDDATRKVFAESYQRSRASLLTLLDEALLLTQIQSNDAEIGREACRLDEMVLRALGSSRTAVQSKAIAIEVCPTAPVFVAANAELLDRAVQGIVQVAIAFTRPGGQLMFTWDADPSGHSRLIVDAEGPELDETLLDKTWELFLANHPDHPAHALGLRPALADRILRLFRGTMRVEKVPSFGVRIVVTPPMPDDPASTATRAAEV